MPSLVLPMTLGMAASGDPEVFHDFKVGQFPVDGTFSRSSTVNGWTLDANGDPVLSSFGTNTPAFVIDPATGKALGYRSLAGFTNSLLWNRDLSNAVWSGTATIAQDAVGLDGVANTAWTVTDSDTGTTLNKKQDITVPDDSNTHAAVFYVAKDSNTSRFPELEIQFRNGTAQLFQATNLNTSTGELTDRATDGASSVEDAGKWWKVILTLTNNASGNTMFSWFIWPARTTTPGSVEASATGSIVYDFGGVYLNSEIAGPPIETEGTPVSTAADDASEPLPASAADGFVWVVHFRMPPTPSSGAYMVGEIDDGGVNNRIRVQINSLGQLRFIVQVAGTSLFNEVTATPSEGSDVKIAVRLQDGNYGYSVSGSAATTNTSTGFPSGLNTKEIAKGSGGDPLNSTIAHEALYDNPADWTDADLQEVTS